MSTVRAAQSRYRRAFEDFAQKVRQTQALVIQRNTDRKAVETALIELETALVAYNHARDAWAKHLLSSSSAKVVPDLSQQFQDNHTEDVRAIAELLWESAGRPEGTAGEDWQKAEEIVKRGVAAG